MSAPYDKDRVLSFDELLGQLLALLGSDRARRRRRARSQRAARVAAARIRPRRAPAPRDRTQPLRLHGRRDGAFWLERLRVREVWEDRFKDGMLLSIDSDRGALFISPLPGL